MSKTRKTPLYYISVFRNRKICENIGDQNLENTTFLTNFEIITRKNNLCIVR